MRKILVAVTIVLVLGLVSTGWAVNLRAEWTPNTEADMNHYVLYRTDGTRVVIGACSNVPQPALPLPTVVSCSFAITPVTEGQILTFVLQAVDNSGNASADSATASYTVANPPPAQPGGPGWKVILQ